MASAKDLTVEEKLKALYQLQKIHSKIDEINLLRGELPMDVKDLEDEIHGLKTRTENLQGEIDDLNGRISENENGIQDFNANIEKYARQMKQVKNNREYDALNKESEMANLQIQLANKKIRDAKMELENKASYLTESTEKLAQKEEDLVAKKSELTTIMAETEVEEEKLNKKVDRASKHIETRLLTAYNRIRLNYKNGLAVVNIERDSCGGCFAKVPPQRQLEVSQRKKIIVCEHCGRVLVDNDIDAKAPKS